MRVLLDTHALLWWRSDDPRLSRAARDLFEDSDQELLWSAVSTAEIGIKLSIGRLELPDDLDRWTDRVIREERLVGLPLVHEHAARVAAIPLHHRDPFDRLLVAQALVEGVPIVTGDAAMAAYDIDVLW